MGNNNVLSVKAVTSGSTATSGKIIAIYEGGKSEIPAVVFSERKTERLFQIIEEIRYPVTKAISKKKRKNVFKRK